MPAKGTIPPAVPRVCAQCGKPAIPRPVRGLCQRCYKKLPEIWARIRARQLEYAALPPNRERAKLIKAQPTNRALAAARARARRAQRIAAGMCTRCGLALPMRDKRYCAGCYEKHYAVIARRRQRAKDAIYARYGSTCACCGEAEPLFLSIDHINGGGTQERKATGRDHYVALAKGPVRDDLRILCHNCNRGRWLNGGECPHGNGV